jgi:hypothetical protein
MTQFEKLFSFLNNSTSFTWKIFTILSGIIYKANINSITFFGIVNSESQYVGKYD